MPRALTSTQALAVTLGVTAGGCVGSDEVPAELELDGVELDEPVDADTEIDAPTLSGSLV